MAKQVSVVNGFVYVLDGNGTLRLLRIDAGTSRSLTLLPGSYEDPNGDSFIGIAATITTDGDNRYHLVYIGTFARLEEVLAAPVGDPADLASAAQLSSFDATDFGPSYPCVKPATEPGDRVYVASGATSANFGQNPAYALQVFNKYPDYAAAIELLGQSGGNEHGFVADISVSGTTAYVADKVGLRLYDISNPANPPAASGFWDTPGSSSGVAAFGTTAYLCSGSLGLQTVDMTKPSAAATIGILAAPGLASVAVRGGFAFATESSATEGLRSISMADPSSPATAGMSGVVIRANRAYTTEGGMMATNNVLKAVDISDPTRPVVIGRCAFTGFGESLAGLDVSGDYAFVCDSSPAGIGMAAVNVNPQSSAFMSLSHFCRTSASGQGYHSPLAVAVSGSYAFVVDSNQNDGGLTIIDVSSPATLADSAYMGTTPLMGAKSLYLMGRCALVVDDAGIEVVRLF